MLPQKQDGRQERQWRRHLLASTVGGLSCNWPQLWCQNRSFHRSSFTLMADFLASIAKPHAFWAKMLYISPRFQMRNWGSCMSTRSMWNWTQAIFPDVQDKDVLGSDHSQRHTGSQATWGTWQHQTKSSKPNYWVRKILCKTGLCCQKKLIKVTLEEKWTCLVCSALGHPSHLLRTTVFTPPPAVQTKKLAPSLLCLLAYLTWAFPFLPLFFFSFRAF